MDKERIRARILEIESALGQTGVSELGLVGSFARGEQTPESDIDFLYVFSEGKASLRGLVELGELLEKTLERKVDLVPRAFLDPGLKEEVLADLVPLLEPLHEERKIQRIRRQFYTVEELQQHFSAVGIDMPRQTIISRCKQSLRRPLEAIRLDPRHQRSPWLILRESGDAWIREAVERRLLASV